MSNFENAINDSQNEKSENPVNQNAPKVFQFVDGNTLMKRKYEPLNICNVSYGDVLRRYYRTEYSLLLARAKLAKAGSL